MTKLHLFFIIFISTSINAQHPIIYQVSPPRSGSTALLRSFEQNQNFSIFNEPTIKVWVKNYLPDFVDAWFAPEIPDNYEKIKTILYNKSYENPVYVKDMIFSAYDWLISDEEFLQNPQVKILILVREPFDALVSFYKNFNSPNGNGFEGDQFEMALGYKQLWKLVKYLKTHASQDKYSVVFSEALCSDPKLILENVYAQFEIPFDEKVLTWPSYGEQFDGSIWNETKGIEAFQHWHADALRSNSFKPLQKNTPNFVNIKEEDRVIVRKIFERAFNYYKKIIRIIGE